MPLARILSRNFQEALRFSEQLRLCCSAIEIEIASPDEDHPHSADFEILIESQDPRSVITKVLALADKQQASVFVAPGTLVAQAENSTNGANPTAEELKSTAPMDSVDTMKSAVETTASRPGKTFDTVQQLWWRYRLLMEIHAAQRERFSADAKRLKEEERRRVRAAKIARSQALRLEETKKAILEAFLRTDPSTLATERADTESSWQRPDDGPGLDASPVLVPESREGRKRARRALARFAVALIILCAAGTFSFMKRRPASPLPNEAVQRSESIEEQIPFGSATASSPQVAAIAPQRVEADRSRANTSVAHLQNGEEVRYLGDDVTVRYFPAKPKKKELTRGSQAHNPSVTRAKAGTSTIAHYGSSATIKEISDLD